ncbi:MAG: 1-deoxy-D-xylulose-5-phosphate reductoisomerase [Desulfovibrionaceae bacterium]|nr:1-deoxy-D-xylulose-5-phosphate reductoisomerase [Desulfovibrionaceae bacterium]
MQYISSLPSFSPYSVRTLSILGSTGSIGKNALDVIARNPQRFRVAALACGRNVPLLAEQATALRPELLVVLSDELRSELRRLLPSEYDPEILYGPDGFAKAASLDAADIVVSAQVGAAGLKATISAAQAGKCICLANKESLVLAGSALRRICSKTGASILPIDSEHYAIFQCLQGRSPDSVDSIVLTASGGPFRDKTLDFLEKVSPEQALKHPNWNMGAKITIDSATMMNKGLEIIEAHHFYDMPSEAIEVAVHPQSAVHSLVRFRDGSLSAQFAVPDMRLPIASCIAFPDLVETGLKRYDFSEFPTLSFEKPNPDLFPCLTFARDALASSSNAPCIVLNAANEVAVDAFLKKQIGFMDIPRLIDKALQSRFCTTPCETFEEIEFLDQQTRRFSLKNIRG